MGNINILSPEAEDKEEEMSELSLRPKVLKEYIGQKKVKENMKVYIEEGLRRRWRGHTQAVGIRPHCGQARAGQLARICRHATAAPRRPDASLARPQRQSHPEHTRRLWLIDDARPHQPRHTGQVSQVDHRLQRHHIATQRTGQGRQHEPARQHVWQPGQQGRQSHYPGISARHLTRQAAHLSRAGTSLQPTGLCSRHPAGRQHGGVQRQLLGLGAVGLPRP